MKWLLSRSAQFALAFLVCGLTMIILVKKPQLPAYAANHISSSCQAPQAICTAKSISTEIEQDEPSILFYSDLPGSGNQLSSILTLPKDPPLSKKPNTFFNFQLYTAFWFGMAVCDTQSYPEQLSTCTPDSDTNIVDPTLSAKHPGTAFAKVEFYPPGWVQKPAGLSCAAKEWCAALVISSFSKNPVTGQTNNSSCQSVAGLEYTNFAFITKSGKPRFGGPPNPIESNVYTFTPDSSIDLLMNPGDQIRIRMHDTSNGLMAILDDQTTRQSGSMTASSANRFGQIRFDPTGTSCNYLPYDFHPMYNTSSELTRVPWMAHSYNISFASEIGQFNPCKAVNPNGTCVDHGGETDCFPASASLLIRISGCIEPITNFRSVSYQPVWPDGNIILHPTSVSFTSPLTSSRYNVNYARIAFETNLPYLESANGYCNINTGIGCTLIPRSTPFYPFFSTHQVQGQCNWQIGGIIPDSINEFHQNKQYGAITKQTYTHLRGVITYYNIFRQIFSSNPCTYGTS